MKSVGSKLTWMPSCPTKRRAPSGQASTAAHWSNQTVAAEPSPTTLTPLSPAIRASAGSSSEGYVVP
jgi:hypothetical protein